MLSKDTPKEISHLFSLVESVEQACSSRYGVEKKSSRGELSLLISTSDGRPLLYLGVRYDLWTRLQHPLWAGVKLTWPPGLLDTFTGTHAGRTIDHEGYRLCPVDCSGPEASVLVEGILRMLKDHSSVFQQGA